MTKETKTALIEAANNIKYALKVLSNESFIGTPTDIKLAIASLGKLAAALEKEPEPSTATPPAPAAS